MSILPNGIDHHRGDKTAVCALCHLPPESAKPRHLVINPVSVISSIRSQRVVLEGCLRWMLKHMRDWR